MSLCPQAFAKEYYKMSVVEIIYEAKCKHCKFAKPIYKGKKTLTQCDKKKEQIRLRDKARKEFELQWT